MASAPLDIVSVCSGIGMLDYGVDIALGQLGYQARVVAYVEREAYPAGVLLDRMAASDLVDAPVFAGDFADLDWSRFSGVVDGIVAGFPCQPWSSAGAQLGTDDPRWLWPAIERMLDATGARFVALENVPGLVSGGGLPHVLASLGSRGFDAEWGSISVDAVGGSHKRDRVFVLAARVADGHTTGRDRGQECDGEARRVEGRHGQAGARGRDAFGRDTGSVDRWTLADTPGVVGERGEQLRDHERQPETPTRSTGGDIFPPGPLDLGAWAEILERDPTLEPSLYGLAHGMADRVDRVKCAGNGVVPLQAAVAFYVLARRLDLDSYLDGTADRSVGARFKTALVGAMRAALGIRGV